jgi:hypothetical protein
LLGFDNDLSRSVIGNGQAGWAVVVPAASQTMTGSPSS